jgi:hypothetical protein
MTPRDLSAPTTGRQVAQLASALGTPLLPWQRLTADLAGEIDVRTGRMRYGLVVLSVPRQAGKTTLLRALGVHAALQKDGRAWYTAQTRNDARDNWMEAVNLVQRSLLAEAVSVRLTNGSEALTVPATGGFFRVFAPLPDALHGKQGDRIFVDEIWSFSRERGAELTQAIVPTMATRQAPQQWLVSTAGTDESTWLKDVVARGREGDPGVAFIDYGLDDDADPLDVDAVCAAHPAYGHTITREAIEAASSPSVMSAEEFARAYGNRWTSAVSRIIDRLKWHSLVAGTTDTIAPASAVSLGVDLAPDRSYATIVSCGYSLFGRAIVEVVEHREGVGWVEERLRDLVTKHQPIAVVVDPVGPSAALKEALVTAEENSEVSARLVLTGPRDLTAATLRVFDAIHEPALPSKLGIRAHAALDAAADSVGKRALSGGWTWNRAGSHPISPLIAATLAWWGMDHPADLPAPAQAPAIY